jgi:hypothetical protein
MAIDIVDSVDTKPPPRRVSPFSIAGGAAVALSIVVVLVYLGLHRSSPTPSGGVAAPAPTCAPSHQFQNFAPPGTADLAIAPRGAVTALLCVYAPDSTLTETKTLTDGVGAVVDALNGLPAEMPGASQPGDVDSGACLLALRPEYVIVLGYADREPVSVEVNGDCASVRQGDAVRKITSLRRLLAFWP